MEKLTQSNIINLISRVVLEQEGRESMKKGKITRKPVRLSKKKRDEREPKSSTGSVAPGHHIFNKCVDDGDPNTILTAIPGPPVAFFVEAAPGWDGYGNGGSSQVGYDSWNNSGTLFSSISTNWNNGEVRNIVVNGQPMGCFEYVGTSSTSFMPILINSTMDPMTQTPIPADVGVSSSHGNCTGCMYGAVDPVWPGDMDGAILDDSEDIAESYTRLRIKNVLRDFY